MKVLVLTSEPITAQQLRDALSSDVDPSKAEVMVVAPALQESGLKFWLSDADDAIARADEVRARTSATANPAGAAAARRWPGRIPASRC